MLKGLGSAFESKSHEEEFPEAKRCGYHCFGDVWLGVGNLMVDLD
jgi:hypothetical protein